MATRRMAGYVLLGGLLVATALGQDAQPPVQEPSAVKAARPAAVLPAFTPQREAGAMSFVQQHHPELASLLTKLKRTNAAEYEQAIRELFRTSERLAQVQERDPQRYALELELWKVESRIRLLAARLTMGGESEVLRQRLRTLLEEQFELRLARQRLDRDRTAERLQRHEEAIVRMEQNREKQLETALRRLLQEASSAERARRVPSGAPSGTVAAPAPRAEP
jgi:hypothetical protein